MTSQFNPEGVFFGVGVALVAYGLAGAIAAGVALIVIAILSLVIA